MTTMPKTRLTDTERRVVALIAEGMDTEDIAEAMFVSRYTIRSKIRRIRQLVGGSSLTELPRLVEEFEKREVESAA
jgi:DNA-binding CsgD family transcriptional regulator